MAAKKVSKAVAAAMIGKEPDFTGKLDVTQSDLDKAYTWYNYTFTSDDAKEFALNYLREVDFDEDVIAKLKKVSSYKMNTMGWNCRILQKGGNLPDFALDYIFEKAYALAEEADNTTEALPQLARAQVDLQARTNDRLNDLIGDVEAEVDKFINNGYEPTGFNIVEWLTKNDVKPALAERISEFYLPLYEELEEALGGEDDDLNEAYIHVNTDQLANYVVFVADLIAGSEQRSVTLKAARAPRKRKIKDPSKVVAKLKYLTEHENLKSVRPAEIIGAQQLWIFNVKTRFLGVYNATGPGFDVKGTTILNYDADTSTSKKLRKPDVVLNEVLTAGKVQLRRVLENVRAVAKPLTGRINADTILLRVIK